MRLGLLAVAILLCACDRRPELALCSQVDSCERAQLIVSENVCADQAQLVLEDESPECQRCVVGLRCPAIEGVLAGKNKIRTLCSACSERLEVPLVEGPGMLFLTPAIVYAPGEQTVETKPDDVTPLAELVCSQGEECEGVQLLLNREECVRQVGSVLVTRDPECRVCASSLSCAGILAVVQAEQKLSGLCKSCGALLDAQRAGAAESGKPFLLIPGFVAMPPPEPSERQAQSAESPAPAEGATKPAASAAPTPASVPTPPKPAPLQEVPPGDGLRAAR